MKLVETVDAMTDEQSCALFIDQGPVYVAVYGHNDFAIFPDSDDLNFANDGTHLIRVGERDPNSLSGPNRQEALTLTSSQRAAAVVGALVKGNRVRLRYFDWPDYAKHDTELEAPNLAYVYNMGRDECGWKDLGVSGDLSDAELDIYKSDDHDGYSRVKVVGNEDLGIQKGFDEYGGGCHISIGVSSTFGMKAERWTNEEVSIGGDGKMVIKNSKNKVVFSESLPESYGSQERGNHWPPAEEAAEVAFKESPHGSIEILEMGYTSEKASLYGFKRLWRWGVKNCGLPSLTSSR